MANDYVRTAVGLLQQGKTPAEIQALLKISPRAWSDLAVRIKDAWKTELDSFYKAKGIAGGEIQRFEAANNKLADFALALHPLITAKDLSRIEASLTRTPVQVGDVESVLLALVAHPRIRAAQLWRLGQIETLAGLVPYVDSATFAYCRGNLRAAYLCLVPQIEGLLQRWHDEIHSRAAPISSLIAFIERYFDRQPRPGNVYFVESYHRATMTILKNHFFATAAGAQSYEDFNRHTAVHMLSDNKFYLPKNYLRALVLFDSLLELYVHEKSLAALSFPLSATNEVLQEMSRPYELCILMGLGKKTPEVRLLMYQ